MRYGEELQLGIADDISSIAWLFISLIGLDVT
jgi:hypothetical protein